MSISIEYVTDDDVPFALYDGAAIEITSSNKLTVYGYYGTLNTHPNCIYILSVPYNALGWSINGLLKELKPVCERLIIAEENGDDAMYDAAMDDIEDINRDVDDYDSSRIETATVFSPREAMEEWFINGEPVKFIREYTKKKLLYEDFYVYFPYDCEDYADYAEEFYKDRE